MLDNFSITRSWAAYRSLDGDRLTEREWETEGEPEEEREQEPEEERERESELLIDSESEAMVEKIKQKNDDYNRCATVEQKWKATDKKREHNVMLEEEKENTLWSVEEENKVWSKESERKRRRKGVSEHSARMEMAANMRKGNLKAHTPNGRRKKGQGILWPRARLLMKKHRRSSR